LTLKTNELPLEVLLEGRSHTKKKKKVGRRVRRKGERKGRNRNHDFNISKNLGMLHTSKYL
jgi:hypothetical protein